MKNLNIKWIPETSARIFLAAASAEPASLRVLAHAASAGCVRPCTRLIVISGGADLRANVTAVQHQPA